jgi:hypothetical protein
MRSSKPRASSSRARCRPERSQASASRPSLAGFWRSRRARRRCSSGSSQHSPVPAPSRWPGRARLRLRAVRPCARGLPPCGSGTAGHACRLRRSRRLPCSGAALRGWRGSGHDRSRPGRPSTGRTPGRPVSGTPWRASGTRRPARGPAGTRVAARMRSCRCRARSRVERDGPGRVPAPPRGDSPAPQSPESPEARARRAVEVDREQQARLAIDRRHVREVNSSECTQRIGTRLVVTRSY